MAVLSTAGCGGVDSRPSSSAGSTSSGSTASPEPSSSTAPRAAQPTGRSEPHRTTSTVDNAGGERRGVGAGRGSGLFYDVVGISDGDTIRVRIDGAKETVRIIGLDTPETKKPKTPVQCFGKEASSTMQSLVQSKQVQLEADASQGERDRYGRLLRHVFVNGSTNVALAQIEGGFGREYTYDGPYAHRLEYLAAQQRAKSAHVGTWGPPCNGFHKVNGAVIVP